jgi:hypothetical protein
VTMFRRRGDDAATQVRSSADDATKAWPTSAFRRREIAVRCISYPLPPHMQRGCVRAAPAS